MLRKYRSSPHFLKLGISTFVFLMLSNCRASQPLAMTSTADTTQSRLPNPSVFPTAELLRTRTPEPKLTHSPSPSAVGTALVTPEYDPELGELPEECYVPIEPEELTKHRPEICSDFTYSSDGRFIAFFFGLDKCGRRLMVLNQENGTNVFSSPTNGYTSFEFLENGKLLYTISWCEGGHYYLLDLTNSETISLGETSSSEEGELWNDDRSALAVSANRYHGFTGAVWGYNADQDFIFLSEPEVWQKDDHIIWSPDGTHLIFQHREMISDPDSPADQFPSGRQIISVDAATGEKTILVGDQNFDYHLCPGHAAYCDRWYGDWIQVRRFPFEPQQYIYDPLNMPDTNCFFYGIECDQEPALYALNWRTGELIPWDESVLPTPLPPPPTETPDPKIGSG